jgi:DNA-binding CsgD family transcriptional regulator
VDFARALGISANYVSLLVNGRKKMVSRPLARLIETTYAYRAEWVLTGGGPVRTSDANRCLQESTVEKILRMDGGELRAVAAYIRTLDDMRKTELAEAVQAASLVRAEQAAPASQITSPVRSAGSDVVPLSERLLTLTGAERNVYDLFAQGCAVRQAAERLDLSVNTIKTHVKKIYKKLGVSSRKDFMDAANGVPLTVIPSCENDVHTPAKRSKLLIER